MHFNRRSLLGSAAATLAAGSVTPASAAKSPPSADVEPRGTVGRLERLPTLDLEANDEFLTTFRGWVNSKLQRAADERSREIGAARGLGPRDDVPLADAFEMFKDDPVIQMRNHAWLNAQNLMWDNLRREFHSNYDAYMAEMEAADKTGPGTLELNPGMEIPDYTRHEIHIQPGGYVGDAFSGHMYHYGTNNFYTGRNYQDDLHVRFSGNVPVPPDGKVKRILDMGCGVGQLTVALKQRFPEAEVWGIDVGGPMVRYAHMRAVDLKVDVNFAQRLAEDSRFPDGHFDIVTSYILHHEVPTDISQKIIREAARVTRAGGVYYPIDFNTAGGRNREGPYAKLRDWMSHRWNHERWLFEYFAVDHPAEMRAAGFDVDEKGPASGFGGGRQNVMGIKRA